MTNDLISGSPFKPFRCLVFKGLVPEIYACCFAAGTANALIGLNINRALLIFHSMNRAYPHCIAIFAIMLADSV
jgi:hypothetical protein